MCRLELALGADSLRLEPAPITPEAACENETRLRARLANETAEQLRDWSQSLLDTSSEVRKESRAALDKATQYVKDRKQ